MLRRSTAGFFFILDNNFSRKVKPFLEEQYTDLAGSRIDKRYTRGFTSDVVSAREETVFDYTGTKSFIKCSTAYLFRASWCFPLACAK